MPEETMVNGGWDTPEERVEIKPFVKLYELDEFEQQTLNDFLKAPTVEIHYELNDETDYKVGFRGSSGQVTVARISDCVTINGVRWHLTPGRNVIPKQVYEFIMQCPEQRRRVYAPTPNKGEYLGDFRPSRSRQGAW